MKTKNFFTLSALLLFGSLSQLTAQVTATGFPPYYTNSTNYNYFNYTYNQTTNIPSNYLPVDSPSNTYVKGIGDPGGAGGNGTMYIFKKNNYWYVNLKYVYNGSDSFNYYFRTQNQHTNVNPPCSANWITVNNSTGLPETPSGPTGLPSGVGTYPISMTGTCFNAGPSTPVSTSSMTPSGVILPQFSTADIANIQNPTPGQMVWNTNELCIQVYNGTSWNCAL